jgi:hypothetical protein
MELATLGRVAVPLDPIPIREGQMLLGKCSVSFAITCVPDEKADRGPGERIEPTSVVFNLERSIS